MLRVQFLLLFLVVACSSEEHGCNIFATILRETSNEGFHRKLTSLVEVVNVHSNVDNCQLVLQENLPSNVFVNPDELRALARSKELFAKNNSTVDVEAIESTSLPFSTVIYARDNHVTHNLLSAQFVLPIHLRYHAPMSGINFHQFYISKPTLLMKCSRSLSTLKGCSILKKHKLPCTYQSAKLCEWHELPYKTNAEKIPMRVPIGNTNNTILVGVITFLVTIGGCVCILSSLISVPDQIHEITATSSSIIALQNK